MIYDPNDFDGHYKMSVVGCLVILLTFFILVVTGCGQEGYNSFRDIAEETRSEEERLDDCFHQFKDFNHPERIERRLLLIVCEMLEDTGLGYFHHSDFRVSQHETGRALDFHLSDYVGLNYQNRLRTFDEDFLTLHTWINDNYPAMGFGFYPQWNSPGFHLDTFGLDAGEKEGRRWSHIGGRYVGFQVGLDWLDQELNKIYMDITLPLTIPYQRDAGQDSL